MRIATFITARMKSKRLPKKVTKEIEGKPMIVHQIERLQLAQKPEFVAICTSTNPQDDILEEIAKRNDIRCFRGSEDDVLLRNLNAAKKFNVDIVDSCTADNPLVDPNYIDKLVDFHISQNNDYSKIKGLPFGTFSYVVSRQALEEACEIKAREDTEVWGNYFTETGYFDWGELEVKDQDLKRPNLRLTVDYPEDFELMKKIFDELYRPGEVFTLKEVISLLDENPNLKEINENVSQKEGKPIKTEKGLEDEN